MPCFFRNISRTFLNLSTIITIEYFRSLKITNIKTNIICNFSGFFTNKNIKYAVFQKMIFNIENLDKKAIGFNAYINKIRLYLFIYIKGHNKL